MGAIFVEPILLYYNFQYSRILQAMDEHIALH